MAIHEEKGNLRPSVGLGQIRVRKSTIRVIVLAKALLPHSTFSADTHVCEVYCYIYENFIPHSLDLTINSVYFNDQGVPTVLTNVVQVP
jgi:hypothetical protein